jgi:hypothetical protein
MSQTFKAALHETHGKDFRLQVRRALSAPLNSSEDFDQDHDNAIALT